MQVSSQRINVTYLVFRHFQQRFNTTIQEPTYKAGSQRIIDAYCFGIFSGDSIPPTREHYLFLGAAIAQWIRLCFFPAVPGSIPEKSSYIWSPIVLYLSLFWEKKENKQKEAGFVPFFKTRCFFFVRRRYFCLWDQTRVTLAREYSLTLEWEVSLYGSSPVWLDWIRTADLGCGKYRSTNCVTTTALVSATLASAGK